MNTESITTIGSAVVKLTAIALCAIALRSCQTLPDRDLHACFAMVRHQPGVWSGSTSPDSAKIATCFRFHRKEIAYALCGVTQDSETGEWRIHRQPIYEQRAGHRVLVAGDENCTFERIRQYIGDSDL